MKIQVLDKGYVELVDKWGGEIRIIEAARMSTGKGFLGWEPEIRYICPACKYTYSSSKAVDELIDCPNDHGRMPYKLIHHGDQKLLEYLFKNKHTSPFEMCGMTIEVKAPIFVFREWHRHRTQSYNEFSARYAELPNEFYTPSVERLIDSSKKNANKQVSGSKEIDGSMAVYVQSSLEEGYGIARSRYEALLATGVAKEIARLVIPVSQYSKMRASANLVNWMRFLHLRLPENAQWEIRQYAGAVQVILNDLFPRTMKMFSASSSPSQ